MKGSIVIILIVFILVGDIIVGIIGVGSPVQHSALVQTNTNDCVVTVANGFCQTSPISFAIPYSKIPLISQINETFLPTVPQYANPLPSSGSSEVITFQTTPQNHTRLLFASETPVTITIPNTDTNLKTYTGLQLNAQKTFPTIIIEGEGYITLTSALATQQDVTIKIKDGATTLQSIVFNPEAITLNSKTPFAIKASQTGNPTVGIMAITVSAPAADANTQITLNAIRVYAVETNFVAWILPPATTTELYGTINNRQKFFFTGDIGININLCVFLVVPTFGNGETLNMQYSPDATTWTDLGPSTSISAGGVGAPTLRCSTATVTLPVGLQYVRIVIKGSGNTRDFPALGAITMAWQGGSSSTTITDIALCIVGFLSITPTSFVLQVLCYDTLIADVDFFISWQSIG